MFPYGTIDPLRVATRPDGDVQKPPSPTKSPAPREETGQPAGESCSPFIPDPDYGHLPYDPEAATWVYEGKLCNPTQRPLVEWGRGLYLPGELPPAINLGSDTNLIMPSFLVFGDFRTAAAYVDNGNRELGVWANRLNLDFDLRLTGTERLHAFWGPLDKANRFTRVEFDGDRFDLREEFDKDFDTLFFEGDLGYIMAGFDNRFPAIDLPFVIGKYPMLYQNGIWFFDAVEAVSVTIPAKNSRILDWSNYDLTFFAILEDIDSPAFASDNDARGYGMAAFIEAYNGYIEAGYAFLDDQTGQGLSYHNLALSYTRRYWHRVSNSIRVIVNAGQDPVAGPQTADGQLLLVENALISSNPNFVVPYLNLFAGFGRPQAVASPFGLLLNTGINFESDGLTGYPTLDPTANDTWGGALGVNLLGAGFTNQLILEAAMLQTRGNDPNRNAKGDQYALGMRYQIPINWAWLVRMDAMYGWRDDEADLAGARMELRWKF
ncbi:MAG: hypothetical protein KDA99_03190 [Planctomycetales bacterium]|nr:hypothetical protein [Planctomycetales bacterium]